MNSGSQSVIQVRHKYQNILKPFFFIGGTYKYKKKNTQKLAKAFERFLRIVLQLCRSIFRLIISEQKYRCKSHGTGVEMELSRMQSGIQTKYEGVQSSPS